MAERRVTTVRVGHTSMQFSDSGAQKKSDAKRIFARAVQRKLSWLTGTEAGMGHSADLRRALKKEAENTDYRFTVASDVWIAVRKDLILPKTWKRGFIQTLEANTGSKTFSDRGICWAQFETARLGQVSVGVAHYMTDGRKPGDEYYNANTKLTRAIGEWGKIHGKGKAICFFHGDANIPDRDMDVFRGQPFTTLADELKRWQNTGHGPIDFIASYDADGRVKGKAWNVLDDKEFHLFTDHFACEGTYEISY